MNLQGVNWVVVGGESGPGARPMDAEWVRDVRAQCRGAKVAFFFKQWGGVRKAQAGRELDRRTYNEFPTVAQASTPASLGGVPPPVGKHALGQCLNPQPGTAALHSAEFREWLQNPMPDLELRRNALERLEAESR